MDVQQILHGVHGVVSSHQKPRIDLVPLDDRVALLNMSAIPPTIAPGSWVRIKRKGRYRNDLGLIHHIEDQHFSAIVFVVPRIPLDRKRDQLRRAKPALFDADAIQACYGTLAAVKRNQVWIFKNQIYKYGLLELEYALHEISDRFVEPSEDELDIFRQTHEQWVVDASHSRVAPLSITNRIRVIAGPHRGLSGYLTDIREDHTATFETDSASIPLQVHAREVRKLFLLGDSVKAMYGEHKGAEGFIVEIGEVSATIYRHKVVTIRGILHRQPGDEVGCTG
jgi:transcription elongation factor SPT5